MLPTPHYLQVVGQQHRRHRSTSMIENVYGHTIDQRTRVWRDQKEALPEEVAFRIEEHQEVLGERLLALR